MTFLRKHWRSTLLIGLTVAYVALAWIYASATLSGTVLKLPTPVIDGIAEEPVTLLNGDIELDAGFYRNPAEARCAVVLLHGVNADRSDVLRYAPLYWDLGCSLFSFDHRDHGRSTSTHRTYGFYESVDAKLAVQWVIERTGLAPSQIGLHGISYGAATALEVLEIRDDLAFVVADTPYSSMRRVVSEVAAESLWIIEPLVRPLAFLMIEQRADMEAGQVAPVEAVIGKATPILVIHTTADQEVPEEHSVRVAAANSNIERHVIDGDGIHIGAYLINVERYTELVHEFIERVAPQLAN